MQLNNNEVKLRGRIIKKVKHHLPPSCFRYVLCRSVKIRCGSVRININNKKTENKNLPTFSIKVSILFRNFLLLLINLLFIQSSILHQY